MTKLDLDALTLGEIATIEGIAKMPIDAIGDDEAPRGNALAALAMIAKRRAGFPAYKLAEALALTADEALNIIGWNDEDDADEDDAAEPAPASEVAAPATPTRARKPSRSKTD